LYEILPALLRGLSVLKCFFYRVQIYGTKIFMKEDRQRLWDNVNELQEVTNITTRSHKHTYTYSSIFS
jgi:hypothetical protein